MDGPWCFFEFKADWKIRVSIELLSQFNAHTHMNKY